MGDDRDEHQQDQPLAYVAYQKCGHFLTPLLFKEGLGVVIISPLERGGVI
jgi:hypothetical protein